MAKAIGIDLGTTNSCVAVVEAGEPTIIVNPEGGRTTPSVVHFSKNGERLVGQQAKRQAILNPERTVSSIKRKMGTRETATIDGKDYSPEQISALILQKLKADAEAHLGISSERAGITGPAPANFPWNASQLSAMLATNAALQGIPHQSPVRWSRRATGFPRSGSFCGISVPSSVKRLT